MLRSDGGKSHGPSCLADVLDALLAMGSLGTVDSVQMSSDPGRMLLALRICTELAKPRPYRLLTQTTYVDNQTGTKSSAPFPS